MTLDNIEYHLEVFGELRRRMILELMRCEDNEIGREIEAELDKLHCHMVEMRNIIDTYKQRNAS